MLRYKEYVEIKYENETALPFFFLCYISQVIKRYCLKAFKRIRMSLFSCVLLLVKYIAKAQFVARKLLVNAHCTYPVHINKLKQI